MALSFLSGAGSNNRPKHFDIRLDDEYIVFRGNEEEAASAHLRGKLVLCLTDPLTIKHIKLSLTGASKIAYSVSTNSSKKHSKERTFFEKVWQFRYARKGKTETLKAENYEYPFDVVLEGSLPESVEGIPDSFVIYRFKAEIGRKFSKDIVVRKPLRIIRTMDSNALELAHAMTVANVWPNKLEYSISTPSKAVIYGTSIQAEFRLVSLLKGLRIGSITTQVLEIQEFTLNPEAVCTLFNRQKFTRIVAEDEYTVPEDPDIVDEEVEGYKFSRHIELPKSLTKCMQDTETRGIKIRHKLKFNILLHNPDDHTSELRATLPVLLYISPSLAINENNELIDQSPVGARQAIATDLTQQAPPLYGDHQLDQMYSDVNFTGYRTPGNFSTPGTPFGSHSRNISSENLASLGIISTAAEPTAASNNGRLGDVSAAALRHRLQNLRSTPTRPVNEPFSPSNQDASSNASRRSSDLTGAQATDYFSASGTSSRSITPAQDHSSSDHSAANLSRRTSDENYTNHHLLLPTGVQTPAPQFHEVEYLSRVPSYSTAVKTSARTPYSGSDLPSYGAVTSVNASLSSSPYSTAAGPPPMAYIGVGQIAGPSSSSSSPWRGESILGARS